MKVEQIWPEEFARRYREKGYWRGETFSEVLSRRAAAYPEREAVVGVDCRLTYGGLDARASAIASGMLGLGLEPGDRVIVQLPNIANFIAVVFGLFRAGLLPVYALPAHRITELEHFARKSEARAIITADMVAGFDHRNLAAELRERVPAVEHVVIVGDPGNDLSLEQLIAQGEAEPQPLPTVSPSAVAFLQISGGSTGLSKLIPRTHDDYLYSIWGSNEICGVTQDTVYMVALPAAHNFPMSSPGFLGAIYAGARVVMAPDPSPQTTFPLIERERVTMCGLVPPLALIWLEAAPNTQHDISSLSVLHVGGAKLSPEVARRIEPVLGVRLQQVFGMAEGLVNYTRLDDPDHIVINTQGRPISPDDEILIVDDQGNPVPQGEPGYLLTRGPYTIRAYHNDPAANARSFTEDGFYRTGDIVKMTPEGYLVVQGRATDHINRAGEKISAEEIEDHLLAHENVFDAVVVSVPDEYLGERTCAFIIPRGEKPKPAALKAWIRSRGLASFKVPDQFVFVEQFAATAVGKISRKELRAQLRATLTTPTAAG